MHCIVHEMHGLLWTHQIPVPRGIVILISGNVFRLIRCENVCQSHRIYSQPRLATKVFIFLSPLYFHTFPILCIPFVGKIDEETDICQTQNLPKKKKGKHANPSCCASLPSRRRAGPSNRGIPKWAVINLQSTCRLFSRSRSQQSLNGQAVITSTRMRHPDSRQ